MIPTDSGAFNCKYVMHNPLAEENKATLIPIERAEGRFLFVASEDDLNWDSKGLHGEHDSPERDAPQLKARL
ncbi:hypothetical protein KUCAC02_018100 [Chaenocephalus aceratus]|uniref:Uncharacterized protein n=1 Tax=Chaenocephalus aceratus TaxID=36190 RepID=A0ACB9W8U2_CHAAC|nr:hypothetical protein KUCAC02_018100 [Chaenocephalus aceratus]